MFVDKAARRYGIRNVTLYNLDVMPLTICKWAHVDPGEVVEVQRMGDGTGKI